MVLNIIRLEPTPDYPDTSPIHDACEVNDVERVRGLLSTDSRLKDALFVGRTTPLHCCAKSGSAASAVVLCEAGADVNKGDQLGVSPLKWAVMENKPECARVLIQQGAMVDATDFLGETATAVAAERGFADCLRELVEGGAQINFEGQDTPGHRAAFKGSVACLEVLKAAGAHLDAPDRSGNTPIFKACCHGRLDAIRYLLEQGADVSRTNNDQMTVAHILAIGEHDRCLRAVLEFGADYNLRDKDGMAVIHKACEMDSFMSLGVLIEFGADMTTPDEHGNTPVQIARSFGSEWCDEYLTVGIQRNVLIIISRRMERLREGDDADALLGSFAMLNYDVLMLIKWWLFRDERDYV